MAEISAHDSDIEVPIPPFRPILIKTGSPPRFTIPERCRLICIVSNIGTYLPRLKGIGRAAGETDTSLWNEITASYLDGNLDIKNVHTRLYNDRDDSTNTIYVRDAKKYRVRQIYACH